MKKIIVLCLVLFSLFSCAAASAAGLNHPGKKEYEVINPEGYEGYWAEKSGGKFILSVTPAEEPERYDVTVFSREKLPKTDFYKMQARYQKNDGSLYYENGLCVLRSVKKNGAVKDKIRYRNGSGLLYYSFDENVLYWSDYTLKPEERVRIFIKTSAPDPDKAL